MAVAAEGAILLDDLSARAEVTLGFGVARTIQVKAAEKVTKPNV
jgi:hypothetical protein